MYSRGGLKVGSEKVLSTALMFEGGHLSKRAHVHWSTSLPVNAVLMFFLCGACVVQYLFVQAHWLPVPPVCESMWCLGYKGSQGNILGLGQPDKLADQKSCPCGAWLTRDHKEIF
eukprot:1158242-Pelagomonas_calceolata.AAC.1